MSAQALSDLPPTAWLLIGLTLFLVTLAVARGQLALRAEPPTSRRARSAAMVTAIVFAGGLWGAPAWWSGSDGSFPLALDAATGRFLAVGAAVFALAALAALIRPSRQRMRFLMVMLLCHLGPLAAALILWHRDALDWSDPAAWGFALALAVLLPGALLGAVAPGCSAATEAVRPPARGARILLGLALVAALAWGGALYLNPDGPLPDIWLWSDDPLASRLMASALFALAGAAALGIGSGWHSGVALMLVVAWGGGLAVAALVGQAADEPPPWAWTGVWSFAAIAAAIQIGLGANRRIRAADAAPEIAGADRDPSPQPGSAAPS